MSNPKGSKKSGRSRVSRTSFTTRSGNNIKINRGLSQRLRSSREAKAQRKAERMIGMPKSRLKRLLYRLQPRRLANYWFSREGGIMALKIIGIGIAAGFLILVGLFAYFRKDLPKLNDVSGGNIGGSISYYDRTGKVLLWQDYDAVKRIPVQGGDISQSLKDATVAVEDKDFFKHGGFDVRGIARAGVHNVVGHGGTQGGSTITQQLVKLTQNWTQQRSVSRKVKELIIAIELEREYSKQQILAGYLNVAPYGNIEYGAQAAANDYFHKSAKDLSLDEAAFLAAIPKSPSYYSPYGAVYKQDPASANKDLVDRQHYILDLMVQQHMINKQQADDAKKVDIVAKIQPQSAKYANIQYPYFVLTAKKELENKYGTQTVNRGGWKVITTLDKNLQDKSEKLVADNLSYVQRYHADEEAMVGEDVQTGQIVALVGGTNFSDPDHGQNNFASGILLPPGSSFKPYDYTTLIENNNNVGAGSVLFDSEGVLPGYPCSNKALPKNGGNCLKDYDFLQPGPLSLRYALGGSRNIPAVKAMLSSVPNDKSDSRTASVNKVISTASAMMANPYVSGNTYNCYADEALTKTTQCYGASAIGDGAFLHLDDHVNGLSTLGRLGNAIPKTYILKITDAANKVVNQWAQPKGKQVIRPDTAYIIDDMASDPRASYLPGNCSDTSCPATTRGYKFHRFNGWKFAIKTGTTNDGYDGLMTSWSSKYAVVTWVGNHTRHVSLTTSMENMTGPLTRGFMEAAHTNLKPQNWVQPTSIKSLPAFIVRNHIHYGDQEPSPTNDLFPSWYQPKSTSNSTQTLDKISNKVATNCTPSLAKDNAANSNANTWNVDIFHGGTTSAGTTATTSTNDTDDVHNCGDLKPGISLSASGNTMVASIIQGTHPLAGNTDKGAGKVNFIANGQVIQSINIVDGQSSYTLTSTSGLSGDVPITAQVIDSVLYDATSDSVTANFSPSPVATGPTITGISGGGSSWTFNWSGGISPVTIYRQDTNVVLCSSPGTSCTYTHTVPGGTKAYAQDNNGTKSPAVTIAPF
ncbi:MAG: hypothetical protein JWS12_677 [Candidatus Saccharibacteria bacterium]|nr:hypothetical protein [Candidatus Saccharibacteria bacterium]